MRRAGAMRLSVTMDIELVEWLDEYAWGHHQTKSTVIEDLVKALYHEITNEEWESFEEVLQNAGKKEKI